MRIGNLYEHIPAALPQEITDTLAAGSNVRIERIVSRAHHSSPDFWYDQPEDEWVVLLKGEAALRFAADDRLLHMTEGMHVHIRAHERHRVEWTAADVDTIWLAVFYRAT